MFQVRGRDDGLCFLDGEGIDARAILRGDSERRQCERGIECSRAILVPELECGSQCAGDVVVRLLFFFLVCTETISSSRA